MYNIIIMGPQGSGKGTQAERLSKRLGVPAVSTGALFRAEVERNTGMGREIAPFLQKGERVPSDLVRQVVFDRMSEQDTRVGVILDGYPRTTEQAETLDEIMTKLERHITHVLFLDLSNEEAIRRLGGRRVCSNDKCRLSYHIEFKKPLTQDKCDRCGSPLKQRQDDVPEAITRRLELFHNDTRPLLDFYKPRGIVSMIDGSGPMADVELAVNNALGL